MSVQLFLAGLILTYIFENPHSAFTVFYLLSMICFTIYRVLVRHKNITITFKQIIACSISFSGVFTVLYFIFVVIGNKSFSTQYVIPISGMVMGNTMTGVWLGLKTFLDTIKD